MTQKALIFAGVGVLLLLFLIFVTLTYIFNSSIKKNSQSTVSNAGAFFNQDDVKQGGQSALLSIAPTHSQNKETITLMQGAAQANTTKNQAFTCLKTEVCTDNTQCTHPKTGTVPTRRVRLETMEKLPSKQTWIVECVLDHGLSPQSPYICTTGSSKTDKEALGVDNVTVLKKNYGYTATLYSQDNQPAVQPLAKENTSEAYEWETSYSKHLNSVFMMLYDSNGEKISSQADCSVVHDQFGRVFDSYSLEPIGNAAVELFQKNNSGEYKSVSSQVTEKDGSFLLSGNGSYKIKPVKALYTFPGQAAKLNPRVSNFYSNLYHGDEIVLTGKPVLYDIPLDPANVEMSKQYAASNTISILHYFQTIQSSGKKYVIEGQVSHPRASVVVYANIPDTLLPWTLKRGRLLQRTEADNAGYFKIIFPLSILKSKEVVGELEAVKKNTQLAAATQGNKTTIVLNPLINDLKGYAYDASSKLIPGAIVEVRTPVSTKPFFTTQANSEGFFTINPENLPPVEMTLSFVSLNKTVDTTGSRNFISQNIDQLSREEPVLAYTQTGEPNVLGASDKKETVSKTSLLKLLGFVIVVLLGMLLMRAYIAKKLKEI